MPRNREQKAEVLTAHVSRSGGLATEHNIARTHASNFLTHWGLNKMTEILQTVFANAFYGICK